MTVEALAADCVDARDAVNRVQPTPSGAAKRMRRYRQRRREGLRCLTVQLRETEIEALVHKGLLQFETRHSKSEIIKALHDFFDLTLSSNR
jgi:hypothetical protein